MDTKCNGLAGPSVLRMTDGPEGSWPIWRLFLVFLHCGLFSLIYAEITGHTNPGFESLLKDVA